MCSSKEFRKITDHEFIFGNNKHDAGFVYEIPECTEAEMHTINALDSFVEMVGYINMKRMVITISTLISK